VLPPVPAIFLLTGQIMLLCKDIGKIYTLKNQSVSKMPKSMHNVQYLAGIGDNYR
jgi:hypothetical protein